MIIHYHSEPQGIWTFSALFSMFLRIKIHTGRIWQTQLFNKYVVEFGNIGFNEHINELSRNNTFKVNSAENSPKSKTEIKTSLIKQPVSEWHLLPHKMQTVLFQEPRNKENIQKHPETWTEPQHTAALCTNSSQTQWRTSLADIFHLHRKPAQKSHTSS